jgi:glutamine--fructose-6-phosphate transaminase
VCGIVGLIGENIKVIDLIEALEKLEYRGYDSAGIAFLKDSVIQLAKAKGKSQSIEGPSPISFKRTHREWYCSYQMGNARGTERHQRTSSY